eukprot:6473829-Heterocapsa_arctica.AAC.1
MAWSCSREGHDEHRRRCGRCSMARTSDECPRAGASASRGVALLPGGAGSNTVRSGPHEDIARACGGHLDGQHDLVLHRTSWRVATKST